MRICPHCGHRGDEELCPRDGYPTVAADLVAPDDADKGAPPLAGRSFGGRYLVEEQIGEGGMGWVFRATHTIMQQTVALKVMRRDVARNRGAIKRFFQEARACSRLRHPHTIKVHDFGVSDDGYPFLVMEYLDGAPLDRVLEEEGRLAPERALRIAAQICKSLHEAHDLGIVHRDLKPSNVFLAHIPGEVDFVKVLDFGVAKFVAGGETDSSGSLTRTGMVVGTPRYMAPEQVRSRPLDGRTDLYALGHLLFEMLTGRPVFQADSAAELMALQLTDEAPSLDLAAEGVPVPPDLANLVAALLQKDPDLRPASAEVVLRRLVGLGATVSGTDETLAREAAGGTAGPTPARVPSSSRAASPSGSVRSPSLETSGERVRPRRRGLLAGVAAAALLAIAAAVLVFVVLPRDGGEPAREKGADEIARPLADLPPEAPPETPARDVEQPSADAAALAASPVAAVASAPDVAAPDAATRDAAGDAADAAAETTDVAAAAPDGAASGDERPARPPERDRTTRPARPERPKPTPRPTAEKKEPRAEEKPRVEKKSLTADEKKPKTKKKTSGKKKPRKKPTPLELPIFQ